MPLPVSAHAVLVGPTAAAGVEATLPVADPMTSPPVQDPVVEALVGVVVAVPAKQVPEAIQPLARVQACPGSSTIKSTNC